ncbi:MAG: LPP20 family lipoprotein, partial [Treponema sp.]|nr:LPP20 family lipoprotein [Treponema sp.]
LGASFFDFIFYSQIELEPAVVDYTRFLERLTYDRNRDVLVFEGGTLVRFRYAARVAPVNFVATVGVDGRPCWVNSTPSLDGHMVAVGFSQNQVWLRDTVMRSTRATAARLIKSISTTVQTTEVDVVGQGSVTYIHSRSTGNLNGFRVLEFWIDPKNMSVYTLGIARL